MGRKHLSQGEVGRSREWLGSLLGDAGYRALFESISDQAISILDTHGHVRRWNPGAQAMLGYRAAEIVGQHFSVLYTPIESQRGYPSRALETARRLGRVEDEGWRARKDGMRFWAHVVIHALKDEDGQVYGFGHIVRDLTREKDREDALRRSEERSQALHEQAMRDPLTGALNRRHLLDFLHALMRHGKARAGTLLAIDVDHFKRVNDRLGHEAGDRVLVQLAAIATRLSRQGDRLFRIGGDEFLMHLPGGGDGEGRAIAGRLRLAIEAAKILEGHDVTVSIGVAEHSLMDSAETWIQRADAALYEAKRKGRNCVV